MKYQNSRDFAKFMDQNDPIRSYRKKFYFPKHKGGEQAVYLCGNSLGLQPENAEKAIIEYLESWRVLGVKGHFEGNRPYTTYHEELGEKMARLVGALNEEVVVMNSLTVNLHLMMVSFYRPSSKRYKILIEKDAFPSDQYAVKSQLEFHGFEVEEGLLELEPRPGETLLRTQDILDFIDKNGDEIALIMLGGINYYTGQAYQMKEICKKGKEKGCMVGFDLAHAAGNLDVRLHEWNVDFAVWCTYKYLNAGPGSIAACFVHQKHLHSQDLKRFTGWWGHDKNTRFLMDDTFVPIPTAEGWQMSNACIVSMASLRASLELFDEVGIGKLVKKSHLLTGFLEFLIGCLDQKEIEIITPAQADQRGAQLSIRVGQRGRALFERISELGVIADWREPDVIRIAPAPMYNSFEDVYDFVHLLQKAMDPH